MNEIELLLRSPATLVLLAANVIISSAAFNNSKIIDSLLFDVGRMRRDKQWYRMVTSGFIHGDPLHLFMNMLALYFMGPYLEYFTTTFGFLVIYFGSLLGGSLWTWMEHFRDMNYRALGASGAISGVTTATAVFAPFVQIMAFFLLPMPLIVFAICFIVWSAWASRSNIRDGIGHGAHLGGALTGIAIVCLFWPEAPQRAFDQFLQMLPTSI
jgi:membrane associated rhomboid family serine protease